MHLPRILDSIKGLSAKTFVLDSGSTDKTLEIAHKAKVELKSNNFVNHPRQWDFALKNFDIKTPWTIGLDADQVLSDELFELLKNFNAAKFTDVDGIYFNRKNIFQGQWIKNGGYFPFYMLKMFRTGIGFSDLNENMDHRFIALGKTTIWKTGYLIEENLKENKLDFWIEKHRRYSDLIAKKEIQTQHLLTDCKPNLFGNPDEKRAWLKVIWQKLPLGFRPAIYFAYRFFFKLGFLDGKTGRKFHYLHSFWFRSLVDQKIRSLKK